ncbi:hypothetical protein [Methanosphaerula subterraneus]|uniref:hypothetical protein n=1 Tax=Methanosphaerula subterraneus TaxID=3350244 RepID=UPI003F8428EF
MPYFLDSMVIVGYIFYNSDNWGKAAVCVFDDPEPNHSGDSVKRECFGEGEYESGKVSTIKNEVASALRKINYYIKNGRTLDQAVNEIESKRIGEIINDVHTKITISPERPIEWIIRICLNNFQTEVVQRKSIVEKQCQWHKYIIPSREIYETLSSYISDSDDIEVLIDAHYAAQSVPNLIFITGDYNHIIPYTQDILTQTHIPEIKPLGTFG